LVKRRGSLPTITMFTRMF